ncbi:nucleotide-binding-oligomerization-domain like receptor [Pyrrhoderma noxium]|uniref:Nucleotide-binding-oligomerization-domain like receptor n=1 Tax=Pyrrhoderma noxium TaxID=2282107 RepID=A0A286UCN3_9AGAM|nr:nucleotide-binding-oligomerization-domain like receptor [Pyrrhoderma noxium]
MPMKQSGSNNTVFIGTHNEVEGIQYSITGNEALQNSVFEIQGNATFNYVSASERTVADGDLITRLKNMLGPSNFSGDDRPECLRNTRERTLEDLSNWVNSTSKPNMLLLLGRAGTGKSTVATTIADTFRQRHQLGCYLFFSRGKSYPATVIQTIAYHLAVYDLRIAVSIDTEIRGYGELSSATLQSKFICLLHRPLDAVSSQIHHPVLIVLDAIDECGTPEARRGLLNVLRNLVPNLPPNFRFLVTGRPEEDILSLSLSNVQMFTLDQQSNESKEDVYTFIRHELGNLRSLNMLNVPASWPWDENIRTLSHRADGLFVWASTAVNDALPWDEYVASIFKSVFTLILLSKSPLFDHDIPDILGLDLDTTSSLLSRLRSLVIYERGRPIIIHHTSFYDYLVSCRDRPWYVDIETGKLNIVTRCFKRMEESLRFDICKLETSFISNKDIPDLDDRIKVNIPHSLQYICCNWFNHLHDVLYSQKLCDQLKSFIWRRLLFWFEVLSLTGTFDDHIGTAFMYTIQWVRNKDLELSAFLHDAYRQASEFSEPISRSALHIYTSFLHAAKEQSVVAKHYAQYACRNLRLEYIGNKPQNDCIKVIDSSSEILSVSFSPDGIRFASGSCDGSVSIWDAASGKTIIGPLKINEGEHSNEDEREEDSEKREKDIVLSVSFSPDGMFIAARSLGGTIRKWNAISGELVWELCEIHDSDMNSVVFSPDGKSIASGSDGNTIRFWNANNGNREGEPLRGHDKDVYSISFSSNGRYLVSGSQDTTIIMWNVQGRNVELGPLREHEDEVCSVGFSPNGKNIVSGSTDGEICIWNIFAGQLLCKIICGEELYSVTYSPDGLHILAGGNSFLKMWNLEDIGALQKSFRVEFKAYSISFSPDGSRFVTGSGEDSGKGKLEVWYTKGGRGMTSFGEEQEEAEETVVEEDRVMTSIAVSPSGRLIASGSTNGRVHLWDAVNSRLVFGPWHGHRSQVRSIEFSSDEQLIASGSDDKTVKVWSIDMYSLSTLEGHTEEVFHVAFSPKGKCLASASADKTVRIWNIEDGKLVMSIKHDNSVWSSTYSPDGTRIISNSGVKSVCVWDSETGQLISTLEGQTDYIYSVAYSRDGLQIASGSEKAIVVWNAISGQIVCGPITGHPDSVRSLRFSPDGKQILSGFDDGTVCTWNTSTGQLLSGPFRFQCITDSGSNHTFGFNPVFFPDGRRVAIWSDTDKIKIWELDNSNSNFWHFQDKDDWVVGENGELILWIPPYLRAHLCISDNPRILNHSFIMRLHLNTLTNN